MRIFGNASKVSQRLSQPYTQMATGDASQTVFYLTKAPTVPGGLLVFVDGFIQSPTLNGVAGAYSVEGNKVTFASAPGVGTNNIYFFVVSV